VLILDYLGPSLEDIFDHCGRRFSIKSVCFLAIQMVSRFFLELDVSAAGQLLLLISRVPSHGTTINFSLDHPRANDPQVRTDLPRY